MKSERDSSLHQLDSLFGNFKAAPFLFVGSGFSQRYLHTPTWHTLLECFASISAPTKAPYSYRYYQNMTQNTADLPLMATVIEKDYNELWYNKELEDYNDPEVQKQVSELNVSPFKAGIAKHIKKLSDIDNRYSKEIEQFKKLAKTSIAGIITTNYDCLLEQLTGYQVFIGQTEMITKSVLGIGEIYKIHGSVEQPNSIVVTDKDYQNFSKSTPYLSSKLITIFMENPIIFIGYSMSDSNIQAILEAILECYTENNQHSLEDRMYFVEYAGEEVSENRDAVKIGTHALTLKTKTLSLTKITLSNFGMLFCAMSQIRTRIPVRILRQLKQQVVDFVSTSTPTETVLVSKDLDNAPEKALCIYVGTHKELTSTGLVGITYDQWNTNIILNNLHATPDELMIISYPSLKKSFQKLPIFKYLSCSSTETISQFDFNNHDVKTFDDILNTGIIEHRNNSKIKTRSIAGILSDFPDDLFEQCYRIAYLTQEEIDILSLEKFLEDIFMNNPDIWQTTTNENRKSNLRRAIKIYDYVKFAPLVKKEG